LNPNVSGLTCLSDPYCLEHESLSSLSALCLAWLSDLGCGWLSSPTVLCLAWLLDSCYFELDWLSSPSFFRFGVYGRSTLPWAWLITKPKLFGSCMLIRPMLFWTWLTAKFKFFGSDMLVRPMPPWVWLTVKLKCFGYGRFARLMPFWLCWLSNSSYLSVTYLPDPYYLELC
jgi:hypothetical protein